MSMERLIIGSSMGGPFLDALASLGSMLESQSVGNVFEILSNLGHIFRMKNGCNLENKDTEILF